MKIINIKRMFLVFLSMVFFASQLFISAHAVGSTLCPQVRGTEPPPEDFAHYFKFKNPLKPNQENIEAGSKLFHRDAKPIACETCHGFKGDGFGVIFQQLKPYPRDFTCYQTMKDIEDGQLFWVIQQGSHGTRMKAFYKLSETEIWQLILYIRSLAKP